MTQKHSVESASTNPILAGRDSRRRWLPEYWPIEGAFAFFGVAWILGLSGIALPLLAIPLAMRLFFAKGVRLPKGFGWLALFIGWVLLSAVNLPETSSLVFFLWRLANYLSAAIFLLVIYNAPIAKLSTERVARALAVLWVTTVLGGHLALRVPRFEFRSPMERLLPVAASTNDVIVRYIHPRAADVQDFLGFGVARPTAPFVYSNHWGSNLTMLFPFVLLLAFLIGQRRVRIAIATVGALALPPFVSSLNRMAWFSVFVIAILVVATAVRVERKRAIRSLGAASIALLVALALTPFGDLVADRLQTGHSNNTRSDLVEQAFEAANASPLVGHGRPLPNIRFPLRPDIGTQGFLWTVMVCQGYVGLAILALWAFDALRRAYKERRFPEARFALIVIILFILQSSVYDFLPLQVHLVAVAIALERRAAWHRMTAPEGMVIGA